MFSTPGQHPLQDVNSKMQFSPLLLFIWAASLAAAQSLFAALEALPTCGVRTGGTLATITILTRCLPANLPRTGLEHHTMQHHNSSFPRDLSMSQYHSSAHSSRLRREELQCHRAKRYAALIPESMSMECLDVTDTFCTAVTAASASLCAGQPFPDRSGQLKAIAISCFVITALLVGLRFYSRYCITRRLWHDDWMILVAIVSLMFMARWDMTDFSSRSYLL